MNSHTMINEFRTKVAFNNTPIYGPGEEARATCCGPVTWTDVSTLRNISRMGRCSTCGAPVAMIGKATA